MTLADLLPSLRSSLYSRLEAGLWPSTARCAPSVCSAGEIAVARAAGFPAERLVLHGNVKTAEDLKAALAAGVGRIVVDSGEEIVALGDLAVRPQRVLIRITPGVDGHTHRAITTGVEGSKFGFSLTTGAALAAVALVLDQPALRLVGLHCHLGSQITRVAGFELATRRVGPSSAGPA